MGRKSRFLKKFFLYVGVIAGAAGGFGAYKILGVKADVPVYMTGSAVRGDIVLQVAATGTLEAVKTVQVGTQVSGTIAELYADFNSEVKKGQLLAKLDPALFETQVEQQEANVQTAEANLNDDLASIASAEANLEKAKVDVLDKQRKLARTQQLFDDELLTRDDLDTAKAALDASLASQKAADAQIDSAQARYRADESRLNQARASLNQAKVNLAHTIITSPISGTIISRNIDTGQTVAASLSAPTLFTIGEDLTKMQVNTNIDEADVGKLKEGMEATFTVDAFPAETFSGSINQIRLAPTTVQNVVTYNAIIGVANPKLKLRPGMTANVKIIVQKAAGVLEIPNSALRFKPDWTDVEMEAAFKKAGEEKYWGFMKAASSGGGADSANAANRTAPAAAAGQRAGHGARKAGNGGARGRHAAVWILNGDGSLSPVVVRLGLTDGVHTEVQDGKLTAESRVVLGREVEAGRQNAAATRAPGFGGPGMGRFGR